jgi:hypothetical protein
MVYLNKSRAVMTGMLLSLLCVGFFADVNARIQVYKHLESENKSSSRLDLIAYNYTDKYIGNYSVNGIWGGECHVEFFYKRRKRLRMLFHAFKKTDRIGEDFGPLAAGRMHLFH